jgi:hypothetical protein
MEAVLVVSHHSFCRSNGECRGKLPTRQLRAGMLWQFGDFMLRLLLPQTAALHVLCLQLLLPGHLLLQTLTLRAVSTGLLLPGRLLPQAAAMRPMSAHFV